MNWIEPEWPAPANIHAATTLRTGGVSSGNYASFNLARHVSDRHENVASNRRRMKQMLGLPGNPLWLQQVHGKHVVRADRIKAPVRADASFTRKAGVVCAVLTADCLPVLFSTCDGSQIAVAHAGWRGLLSGVIEATLKALDDMDLLVWLGPAIGPQCFEVGGEVRRAYLHKSAHFASAFRQLSENKWFADIYLLARQTLWQHGIEHIYGGGFCTVSDKERFFSYRRDGETGRMATLIWRD